MPARLLLLRRFFMRLDDYLAREEKYEAVKHKLMMQGETGPEALRDPNKLANLLPIVDGSLEKLVLK
ncbi:hypothetical protein LTS18_006389 [Coniosporium uncinatum]|uniref:Uncharacterized protein n=1 Tax=Coniosporium uncinatum TaxID=93489 RepID=A0ACC3DBB6_9PEZI|nr:hypothetical protein LTS18_006389 [Coniosporium uncinatum]